MVNSKMIMKSFNYINDNGKVKRDNKKIVVEDKKMIVNDNGKIKESDLKESEINVLFKDNLLSLNKLEKDLRQFQIPISNKTLEHFKKNRTWGDNIDKNWGYYLFVVLFLILLIGLIKSI